MFPVIRRCEVFATGIYSFVKYIKKNHFSNKIFIDQEEYILTPDRNWKSWFNVLVCFNCTRGVMIEAVHAWIILQGKKAWRQMWSQNVRLTKEKVHISRRLQWDFSLWITYSRKKKAIDTDADCMVPQSIYNTTTEGIGSSTGRGFIRQIFQWGRGTP